MTCRNPQGDGFIRIPTSFATVAQLREMVEFRGEQIRADQARKRELDAVLWSLEQRATDSTLIGDAVRQAQLAGERFIRVPETSEVS